MPRVVQLALMIGAACSLSRHSHNAYGVVNPFLTDLKVRKVKVHLQRGRDSDFSCSFSTYRTAREVGVVSLCKLREADSTAFSEAWSKWRWWE